MKAFTVKPQWAKLFLSGEKTIETRTRNTRYRGPVLIHCSRNPKSEHAGKAIAIAELIDSRPMTPADQNYACIDYDPNLYCWELENIKPIEPIEFHGNTFIYDPPIPVDL